MRDLRDKPRQGPNKYGNSGRTKKPHDYLGCYKYIYAEKDYIDTDFV